jgi:hypothetical protein
MDMIIDLPAAVCYYRVMRLLIVRAAFVLTAVSLITVCVGLKMLEDLAGARPPLPKASVGVISASFPIASPDTSAGDIPAEDTSTNATPANDSGTDSVGVAEAGDGPLDIADIGAGKAQADSETEPADADTDIGLDTIPRRSFGEVWSYILSGRESDLAPAESRLCQIHE